MRQFIISVVLALVLTSAASAQDFLRERTMMLHDPVQGTQVIFLARSNKTYLWHGSSEQIIAGRWSTRTLGTYPDTICLRYGGSDYNPVTGRPGRDPECQHVMKLLALTYEQVDGDLFGLATRGAAPFPLGAGRTTIGDLASRTGVALTGPVIGDEGIVRPGGPQPTRAQMCMGLKPDMYARCMDSDGDPNTPQ